MPDDDQLSKLIRSGFKQSGRDFSTYLEILHALGARPRSRILDFGCSWGYGSWQFAKAGFEVEAYEISATRAQYARDKLSVQVHSELSAITSGFDFVFSSHVLEHISSLRKTLDSLDRLLSAGGTFVALTPNGSADFRLIEPESWQKFWGHVHPNFLDNRFYKKVFPGVPLLLTSSPYDIDRIALWNRSPQAGVTEWKLSGNELLVAYRKRAKA